MTPLPLAKITAAKATEICCKFKPQPEAQALLTPERTPAEYLAALEENQMGEDAVKTLAYGLPERESTHWAAESAGKVSDKLAPADKSALAAAEAWVKDPNPTTQAQAAAAAAKTDHQGPGAWAAQAAAWSKPAGEAATAGSASNLTPHAVVGAVMLSAAAAAKPKLALPEAPGAQVPTASVTDLNSPELQVPELAAPQLEQPTLTAAEKTKSYQALKPFIDLGKEIASGLNNWSAV